MTRTSRQPVLATLGGMCALLASCGEPPEPVQSTLKTERVLGESGTNNTQFAYPRGMDIFEYEGVAHAVLVDKTARIQLMNLDTGEVVGVVHTPRWDRGKPTGLTVAPSILDASTLAVYVADTHEFRVLMYELPLTETDQPVATEPDFMFGSFGEGPGEFIYPTDTAIETNERGEVIEIFVSEYGGNDRINRFRVERESEMPTLVWVDQIGVPGQEVDASDHELAMARPQSIELWTNPTTLQREIVVTSASHHRIGRITTDGELITWFGDPLDDSEQAYNFPYGLTVLEDGSALITEFGGNRITRIDLESGEQIFRYGKTGRNVGQLAQPWAAGVAGDKLVVLDSGNNRVQVCDSPSPLAPEYTRPSRMIGVSP